MSNTGNGKSTAFNGTDMSILASAAASAADSLDGGVSSSSSSSTMNEDWEEWDGRSPFWAHCVAGSLAGVVEHVAIYPLDTVRTHIQVCAACVHRNTCTNSSVIGNNNPKPPATTKLLHGHTSSISPASAGQHHRTLPLGMWQTIRYLVSEPAAILPSTSSPSLASITSSSAVATSAGWSRLFRGIHTILFGCIPAHALYFSSYELVKSRHVDEHGHVSAWGSSLAGATAVTAHDLIMTPLDTLKQRLQIGHYNGAWQAAQAMYKQEGIMALYRSFPVTLLSNVPYGMVMVSTHEACKEWLLNRQQDHHQGMQHSSSHWQVVLASSSIAGCVASAVTTPLDRIKTALQTQQLAPVCAALRAPCPLTAMSQSKQGPAPPSPPHLMNWQQAATTIWKQEGVAGFFRGIAPRILSHTPAVAISWTTYETAKFYLLSP